MRRMPLQTGGMLFNISAHQCQQYSIDMLIYKPPTARCGSGSEILILKNSEFDLGLVFETGANNGSNSLPREW